MDVGRKVEEQGELETMRWQLEVESDCKPASSWRRPTKPKAALVLLSELPAKTHWSTCQCVSYFRVNFYLTDV